MKNYISFKLCVVTIIISAFASCSDDKPEKIALFLPVADFNYNASTMTVRFTDGSLNAIDYLWEFGDGTISTEQNPVHEFKDFLEYTVVLTVTNKNGKIDSKTLILDLLEGPIPDPSVEMGITIDGKFDDWNNVPTERLFTATLGDHITGRRAIRTIKFCGDMDYLYFYAVVEKENFGVLSFYIDKDNNVDTGNKVSSWNRIGADYLMEAPQQDGVFIGGAFSYDDEVGQGTGWAWNDFIPSGPEALTLSKLVNMGDGLVEVEGYLSRTEYTDLGATIRVGVNVANASWSTTGRLPAAHADGTAPDALKVRIPQ